MNLGLALSGGGFRATVFHLGVLARLAEQDLLEDTTFISTVSGGSLGVGLIYASNGYPWPSSRQLLEVVIPKSRELLTAVDLQGSYVRRLLGSPLSLLRSRASDISTLLTRLWGIRANLNEMPRHPRWIINATCYETAKNWRFESKRMGDYIFGYVMNPEISLSDAMAASAAFPALIGPLVLDTRAWAWVRYKRGSMEETEPTVPACWRVHLWDGGVYDNLGIEPLYKPQGGLQKGVDFLIVSDASGRPKPQPYRAGWGAAFRLLDIARDQVRSLRARSVVAHFAQDREAGCYLRIGNSGPYILRQAGRENEIPALCANCLADNEVQAAEHMETTIRGLSQHEFERLFRHGYEVADFTLYAYNPPRFKLIGYNGQQ